MLQSMGSQRIGYNLVTEQQQENYQLRVCVCVWRGGEGEVGRIKLAVYIRDLRYVTPHSSFPRKLFQDVLHEKKRGHKLRRK